MHISRIAKNLGVSRSTIYNWYDKPDISWDHIFQIGKIINHDFMEDFPELAKPSSMVREPIISFKAPLTLEECNAQLSEYKEKYMRVLEKNQELNEKINALQSGGHDTLAYGARVG